MEKGKIKLEGIEQNEQSSTNVSFFAPTTQWRRRVNLIQDNKKYNNKDNSNQQHTCHLIVCTGVNW